MTGNAAGPRSPFARKFERAYPAGDLPAVYWEFIVTDAYLPYRRSFVRGLSTYGPTAVAINLTAPILLRSQQLFDESGINRDTAAGHHPIATMSESPQFLAIGTTEPAAPVLLWHHETGAFHLQFDDFGQFLTHLRTPAELRAEAAQIRKVFSDIRKECRPALARAVRRFDCGELDAAAAELDRVLRDRRPIRYDGRNDFMAIGILCDCFNLRGRIFLAQSRLDLARAAFLDAVGCGGPAYWEAVVDAVVTSFLLNDIGPVLAVRGLESPKLREGASVILARNFSSPQIDQYRQAVEVAALAPDYRAFAEQVAGWAAERP